MSTFTRHNIFRALKFYRNYSRVATKEFEVPTFCNVHIHLPYNLSVQPLNIHKYHDCNKLIVESNCEDNLWYTIDGNNVKLTNKTSSENSNANCLIQIPVKANLYIDCKKDIKVGYFNGDEIRISSDEGNITLDKFHGQSVKVATKNGNIKFNDVVQAADITAIVNGKGSISTGRLQGLKLNLKINEGDLNVLSSYCEESTFDVTKGNMKLENIHKNCKLLLDTGHLKLIGFDGTLSSAINKGHANIYISRLLGHSDVKLADGSLDLILSDFCRNEVALKIKSKESSFSDELKQLVTSSNGSVELNPDINTHSFTVNCLKGSVNTTCASWMDVIGMKFKK